VRQEVAETRGHNGHQNGQQNPGFAGLAHSSKVLSDWQELFAAVQRDQDIADLVLKVASEHDLGGASTLAKTLVERLRPGSQTFKAPSGPTTNE